MTGRTVILGGGFGGIATAVELRRALGADEHEIVLVDRTDGFAMGLRKLWELFGRGTVAEGTRSRSLLERHGVRFVRAEIDTIDPRARAVETSAGRLDGDHLVVALGAVSRPDLVPGLAEHGHDVWAFGGVPAAAEAFRAFEGGRIVVLVAGAPYPCPPAPYECAIGLRERLVDRGLGDRAEVAVVAPMPILLPNAGREGSEWIARRLEERGISYRAGAKTERVEEGRAVLEGGDEEPFDLLVAVPPHRPPEVVDSSGLTAEHGWIGVDTRSLATRFEGVHAVGDVTLIPLPNGLPFPKAGLMAELQGTRVARAIAAEVLGEAPPPPFDGTGSCPIELGGGEAALVEGDWYAEPEPVVTITGPTEDPSAKLDFEREHLARWFGG